MLGMTSCITSPDFSDTPSIDFARIDYSIYDDPQQLAKFDRFVITINYRDGDGDLGLSTENGSADLQMPYALNDANGRPNRFYNNYFLTIEQRNAQGQFVPYVPDPTNFGFTYASRYPVLNSTGRKQPLRGTLTFGDSESGNVQFFRGAIFPSGTVVRFRLSIADRALNLSNEIVSDPITIQ